MRIIHWWLKRGGRWDGQGNLFNLLFSSMLMIDVLGIVLVALTRGTSFFLPITILYMLYAIWVMSHAITGAIPNISQGYASVGVVLTIIPALIVAAVVAMAISPILFSMGYIPINA